LSPKEFFDASPGDLEQVVDVVRSGFGRNLDFEDIYKHVTAPEEVYLLRNKDILAMASYNTRNFCGFDSLIVEGIALSPKVQGKGVFRLLADQAVDDKKLIFLRTQNPRMYRALEKYCSAIYPSTINFSGNNNRFLEEFAHYLGCKIDEKCVVRGYYGGLFYGEEPKHCEVGRFFKEDLKMDLSKGDAVLAVGIV
jgi:hypothetical protein